MTGRAATAWAVYQGRPSGALGADFAISRRSFSLMSMVNRRVPRRCRSRRALLARYDKPSEDRRKVRLAGPFTVESLSPPHRVLGVDDDDELIDGTGGKTGVPYCQKSFPEMILENLKSDGVTEDWAHDL